MDNLADILARRQPQEPPEIRVIKQYVSQTLQEKVGVTVRERDIVVSVRSSALAGALRVHAHRISGLIANELPEGSPVKRLVFRVGG